MAEKRVIEYEAASAVENDDWLLLDGVTEGTRKIRPSVMNGDITSAITTLQGDVGDLADNFAEEYDSSESYAVGDYCTHENILYVCTGATTGIWDGTKWTSTDVAEIAENSGKVNDVQVNGTSVVTNKVANIDLTDMQADIDSKQADTKIGGTSILDNNKVANLDFLASYGEASGSIASFNDGAAMPLKSLKVAIEPVQDLHGYDAPWVGGAGKNKLPLMASIVKSLNTSGTWSGDAYTINNVTFTLETNTEGAITNIKVNSSGATATVTLFLCRNDSTFASTYANQSLILNGCPSGGSEQTYGIQGYRVVNQSSHIYDSGSGTTFTFTADTSNYFFGIFIINGQAVNNISFKPMIRLASVTDGNFAPYSNECPISGHTEANMGVSGVNVWDEEWEVGSFNFSTGEKTPNNTMIRSKNPIPIKGNTQYFTLFLHSSVVSGFAIPLFYDNNGDFISYVNVKSNGDIITTPSNAYYMMFTVSSLYGTTYNNDISINYPSTDTAYHAYNGKTYTIDLDGTRYGCTLDVVSGVLTVDRAYIDMGTINWVYSENAQVFGSNQFVPYVLTNGKLQSSQYKWNSTPNVSPMNLADGEMSASPYFNRQTVMVKDSRYSDATAFKTAMNGVQLVYKIATPTTIQLTPTAVKSLLGTNNIWCDTGDILECKYVRDNSAVINDLIARVTALENA